MFSIYSILFTAILARAALNGPCTASGAPGVCITTSSCSSSGGTSFTGFCPNDPANVKCCTKPKCGSGGTCQFANTCGSGNTVSGACIPYVVTSPNIINNHLRRPFTFSGLCPGPADFKCCLPGKTPGPNTNCGPSSVSGATVSMIKGFEAFVAKPYLDPVGLETVGYGHLCKRPGCTEVPFQFPMTEAQASTLAQSCISADIVDTVILNENQYGALVSWAFNVGCGNSRGSGLISRLNAGEDPNTVASEELPKWRKSGGQVLPGLVTRRNREVVFFQTASSVTAHPPTC